METAILVVFQLQNKLLKKYFWALCIFYCILYFYCALYFLVFGMKIFLTYSQILPITHFIFAFRNIR